MSFHVTVCKQLVCPTGQTKSAKRVSRMYSNCAKHIGHADSMMFAAIYTFMGYRLCRRPLLYDLQDVPTALTITSTLWDCHFQHLSLVLPPSLSLSLPVSLSLSSRLLMRVRVCRPVCTFARASACMCARASASTRGCGCFPAVWGRLQPSPAVSSRLRPSPAVSGRLQP